MKKTRINNLQKLANSIARKHGKGMATTVLFKSGISEGFVSKTTPYGWRKYTTGEYVPNSYRSNFGWKNTYYQPSLCTVILPIEIVDWSE